MIKVPTKDFTRLLGALGKRQLWKHATLALGQAALRDTNGFLFETLPVLNLQMEALSGIQTAGFLANSCTVVLL